MIKMRDEQFKLHADYARATVRHAIGGGEAYPAAPPELRARLAAILQHIPAPAPDRTWPALIGLVAPHLDWSLGERIYAAAYAALRELKPSLVILLGTGHHMVTGRLCLTTKDFATPLGVVPTDRDLVAQIVQAGDAALAPDDLPHRLEHALEFQLVFLQYVLGRQDFRLVPILCGSFDRELATTPSPLAIPGLADTLAVLRGIVADDKEQVLVVAGVDFAHIGPKFGDRQAAFQLMSAARAHDQALLAALCQGNLDAFWVEAQRVQNRYHVCGLSSLACQLAILPPCRGQVLDYAVCHEFPTQSAVSCAAVALTRRTS